MKEPNYELKQELKTLVGEGEIAIVIDKLESVLDPDSSEFNKVLQIKADYKYTQQQSSIGTISFGKIRQARAQVLVALLEVIQSLPDRILPQKGSITKVEQAFEFIVNHMDYMRFSSSDIKKEVEKFRYEGIEMVKFEVTGEYFILKESNDDHTRFGEDGRIVRMRETKKQKQ